MKRKVCRDRVKHELRTIRRSTAARDEMRRQWIIGRCWACFRCPKLLAKLPLSGEMAP